MGKRVWSIPTPARLNSPNVHLHIIHLFHFFIRFVWHSFLIRLCDYLSPFIDNAKQIIRPNKIHAYAYIECHPCLSFFFSLSLPLPLCMRLCPSSRFLCTRSNHICFSFFYITAADFVAFASEEEIFGYSYFHLLNHFLLFDFISVLRVEALVYAKVLLLRQLCERKSHGKAIS